ncbi:MAG: STAS domain-containing protein [Isosphaeraceae bacterium]|nr:STAS domain-containing protein [Isosphaeraceae bacterium]
MAATPRIEVRVENDARVISFKDRLVFDERTVREAFEQISEALPSDGSPIRLILDFNGVELISSTLLGKLVLLQRRVDGSGGKMRLCEMGGNVYSVCKTSNLDRLFAIDRDVRAALEHV